MIVVVKGVLLAHPVAYMAQYFSVRNKLLYIQSDLMKSNSLSFRYNCVKF